MTPDQLRVARAKLGLSTAGLARALGLGRCGARTVRRWEAGEIPISGRTVATIELLLAALPQH